MSESILSSNLSRLRGRGDGKLLRELSLFIQKQGDQALRDKKATLKDVKRLRRIFENFNNIFDAQGLPTLPLEAEEMFAEIVAYKTAVFETYVARD